MEEPGAGYGGYVRLKEVIEKGYAYLKKQEILLEVKGKSITASGKQLQGITIMGDQVRITGTHYTYWERATRIRSDGKIEPSLNDPFVYLSEPGKMEGWAEGMIKKETGAAAANTGIMVTVVVPIERVWIKASRFVAHYAIEGSLFYEIKDLELQRVKAAA
jgi:hypothetical protein